MDLAAPPRNPTISIVGGVNWTSSDEKVATVDENGKVTAIAAGEATITANAGEKSATYKLTVQAKKVAQTSNKTYSSSSSNSSAAVTPSNPAPVAPAPAQPDPAPVQPDPQPEQPSNPEPAQPSQPSGGDSGSSSDKYGEGYDRWHGPVNSAPTDNGCPPEDVGILC